MVIRVAAMILLCALSAFAARGADGPPGAASAEWTRVFETAGGAFDEGRYPDAIDLYTSLLDQNVVASELLLNLGNAYFRSGRLSDAILHYRRAWYLAPRDADIRANLGFAMREANAVISPESPVRRVSRNLTVSEWCLVATLAWWMAGLAAVAAILKRNFRPVFGRMAALILLVLIVALAAVWDGAKIRSGREQVIVRDNVEALYAPLEDAQAHFAVPAGSIVELRESAPPWAKVSVGNETGWIRTEAAKTVANRPAI